jgi:hypothetical protein
MVKIYITLAALTFITFMSGAANAMIQEKGVFVPSHCGVAEEEMPFQVNVKSLCFGTISGEQDPVNRYAAEFTFTDGTSRLFHVRSMASELVALEGGRTETLFFLQGPSAEVAKLKVARAKGGGIQSAIGTVGTTTFFIPAFENVFVAL